MVSPSPPRPSVVRLPALRPPSPPCCPCWPCWPCCPADPAGLAGPADHPALAGPPALAALLPLLALLTLLAGLAFLTRAALLAAPLLALLVLAALGALAHALIERLHAACELARLVERLPHRVGRRASERRLGFAQLVADRIERRADVLVERLRVARLQPCPHHRTRPADAIAHGAIAQGAGRLRHLARRLALLARDVAGRLVHLPLELTDAIGELFLPLAQLLDALRALSARRFEIRRRIGDVALLARDLLGLLPGIPDVALGAAALALLELALRFLQPFERRRRLGRRRRVAIRRRPPHRVGRVAQLARRLRQIGAVLLARQLLEPACGFFDLLRQRPLLTVAAAAALLAGQRPLPLALGLLLLPPRQLAQLLHQLVDLLVGVLLLGALRGLVLVGDLVELHLEEIRELLRRRALPAAAAAPAAALHADLHFVLFFGLLQDLQRLLLGLERALRIRGAQLAFRRVHRRHRLRQQLGDLLERGILLDQPAVHARQQSFDLLAQLRLRQRHDDRALLQLLGAHRLPVAVDVEGRGDDLALLLRQRADLVLLPAATAAAPGLRLGALEVLLQRPHLQEVDVARRLLAAAAPRRCRRRARSRTRSRPATRRALPGRTCGRR